MHYGLSDGFTAADGIDQGEIISPLLWRIFYDPLLYRLQFATSLGYRIQHVSLPKSDHRRDLRVPCLAFTDDTVWIGNSKQDTQAIVEISNSFFRLNDIEINGEKQNFWSSTTKIPYRLIQL